MKQKILVSLTGAVLTSILTNNVALGSTIFSGNTQRASVQGSQKLLEKPQKSGSETIFRAIVPKPQNLLRIAPEYSFGVTTGNKENVATNVATSSGNPEAANLSNENIAPVVDNSEPAHILSIISNSTVSPSVDDSNAENVEVAVNPYIAPEAIPAVSSPAPARTPFERGEASWYGPGFDGNYSANGEVFNQYAMTAAHPSLPFGTRVLVTNLHTGRSIVVRITDRGPFAGDRVIDLSLGAAESIGMIDSGVADVQLDIIQP